MNVVRWLMCLIFPPFAVADRGCGVMTIVFFLTLIGWFPGVIAAIAFNLSGPPPARTVTIPYYGQPALEEEPEAEPEYIHLADGTIMEVIDDDTAAGDDLLIDKLKGRKQSDLDN